MLTTVKKYGVTALTLIVLLVGLWKNIPSKLSDNGVENFDWWSNDIMISDLMYRQNYQLDNSFMNIITPTMICGDDNWPEAKGVQEEMFRNGIAFDRNTFKQYTSNIVIQRYLYAFLDRILPCSNKALLSYLYAITCFLSAFVIFIIINWVGDITDSHIGLLVAVCLVVLCPYFTMYGKNLYWSIWSLFLPMALMCVITNPKRVTSTVEIAFVSFLGCLLKQLLYFEFVSTAMIAMIVPLLYYVIVRRLQLRAALSLLASSTLAALSSFVVVFCLKSYLLVKQYGIENALQITRDNLEERLLNGNGENWTAIQAILNMLGKNIVSLRYVVTASMWTGVIILVLLGIIIFLPFNALSLIGWNTTALFYVTVISFLAPCSWFVMAAPHTTIHNLHCTIL